MLAANGEPAMPPNERLNGGKLDLVIFADQFTLGVSSKRPKAIETMRRLMILNGIGRFAQFTRMAFVSGLGAAGLGLLAPLFSIRRWRFGRRARGLVRTLKPKHQLDQIVLAQPLQIIAIHPNLESATRPMRKGWVITTVGSVVASGDRNLVSAVGVSESRFCTVNVVMTNGTLRPDR